MTYSFNTWNHSARWGLPPSLPEQIAAAAQAGFDHVGLDIPSLLAHQSAGLAPEQLRHGLGEVGITCFELVPLPISADTGTTDGGVDRVLTFGPVLGAQQVLAVVDGGITAEVVANVGRCADRLAEGGMAMSVEFLAAGEINSITAVRELVDAAARPGIGVVVDSWHFFAGPDNWATLDALPEDRLGFVQFSDAVPPESEDVRHEYVNRRVLPGQGGHDLRGFSDHVLRRWPEVVVSVEVLSSWWRTRPVDQFASAVLQLAPTGQLGVTRTGRAGLSGKDILLTDGACRLTVRPTPTEKS